MFIVPFLICILGAIETDNGDQISLNKIITSKKWCWTHNMTQYQIAGPLFRIDIFKLIHTRDISAILGIIRDVCIVDCHHGHAAEFKVRFANTCLLIVVVTVVVVVLLDPVHYVWISLMAIAIVVVAIAIAIAICSR